MIKSLVTPADIRIIEQKLERVGSLTPQESTLLSEASMSESQIQIACHNMVKVLFPDEALFVQIDNGGAMGVTQKMKKKAEGTIAGMPDCMILLWKRIDNSRDDNSFIDDKVVSRLKYKRRSIYVEFKKIGAKPPTEKQTYWHIFFKDKGEFTHFCNNTVYFTKVIMKEIEEFLR